jgi:hypothetical protein
VKLSPNSPYQVSGDRRNSWEDDANCAGTDVAAFFPEEGGDGYAAARRICRRCPVTTECLEDALAREAKQGIDLGHRHGMRGGKTPKQRMHIARCRLGVCAHPEHATDAVGIVERVRQMAEQQHRGDLDIGAELGLPRQTIRNLRREHNIAAGAALRKQRGADDKKEATR